MPQESSETLCSKRDSGYRQVVVKILGVRNVKVERSNLNCVCEVVGRPTTFVRTDISVDSYGQLGAYPWNSVAQIIELSLEDTLEFTVVDTDHGHDCDEFIGKARLTGSCLTENCFCQELPLIVPLKACGDDGVSLPPPTLLVEVSFKAAALEQPNTAWDFHSSSTEALVSTPTPTTWKQRMASVNLAPQVAEASWSTASQLRPTEDSWKVLEEYIHEGLQSAVLERYDSRVADFGAVHALQRELGVLFGRVEAHEERIRRMRVLLDSREDSRRVADRVSASHQDARLEELHQIVVDARQEIQERMELLAVQAQHLQQAQDGLLDFVAGRIDLPCRVLNFLECGSPPSLPSLGGLSHQCVETRETGSPGSCTDELKALAERIYNLEIFSRSRFQDLERHCGDLEEVLHAKLDAHEEQVLELLESAGLFGMERQVANAEDMQQNASNAIGTRLVAQAPHFRSVGTRSGGTPLKQCLLEDFEAALDKSFAECDAQESQPLDLEHDDVESLLGEGFGQLLDGAQERHSGLLRLHHTQWTDVETMVSQRLAEYEQCFRIGLAEGVADMVKHLLVGHEATQLKRHMDLEELISKKLASLEATYLDRQSEVTQWLSRLESNCLHRHKENQGLHDAQDQEVKESLARELMAFQANLRAETMEFHDSDLSALNTVLAKQASAMQERSELELTKYEDFEATVARWIGQREAIDVLCHSECPELHSKLFEEMEALQAEKLGAFEVSAGVSAYQDTIQPIVFDKLSRHEEIRLEGHAQADFSHRAYCAELEGFVVERIAQQFADHDPTQTARHLELREIHDDTCAIGRLTHWLAAHEEDHVRRREEVVATEDRLEARVVALGEEMVGQLLASHESNSMDLHNEMQRLHDAHCQELKASLARELASLQENLEAERIALQGLVSAEGTRTCSVAEEIVAKRLSDYEAGHLQRHCEVSRWLAEQDSKHLDWHGELVSLHAEDRVEVKSYLTTELGAVQRILDTVMPKVTAASGLEDLVFRWLSENEARSLERHAELKMVLDDDLRELTTFVAKQASTMQEGSEHSLMKHADFEATVVLWMDQHEKREAACHSESEERHSKLFERIEALLAENLGALDASIELSTPPNMIDFMVSERLRRNDERQSEGHAQPQRLQQSRCGELEAVVNEGLLQHLDACVAAKPACHFELRDTCATIEMVNGRLAAFEEAHVRRHEGVVATLDRLQARLVALGEEEIAQKTEFETRLADIYRVFQDRLQRHSANHSDRLRAHWNGMSAMHQEFVERVEVLLHHAHTQDQTQRHHRHKKQHVFETVEWSASGAASSASTPRAITPSVCMTQEASCHIASPEGHKELKLHGDVLSEMRTQRDELRKDMDRWPWKRSWQEPLPEASSSSSVTFAQDVGSAMDSTIWQRGLAELRAEVLSLRCELGLGVSPKVGLPATLRAILGEPARLRP